MFSNDKINVLLYSQWRSGSNLFCSIFVEKLYYYYLDDYYSQLSFNEVSNNVNLDYEQKQSLRKQHNNLLNYYLGQITKKVGVYNTLIKIMPTDLEVLNTEILRNFTLKILLYRKNIFDIIKSFAIAKITNAFWYEKETQQFTGNIDENLFLDLTNKVFGDFRLILDYDPIVDYTYEYENDLLPYIAQNPTRWKKQLPYNITNLDNLYNIYNDVFHKDHNIIEKYFISKRQASPLTLDVLVETIKEEVKFWRDHYIIK